MALDVTLPLNQNNKVLVARTLAGVSEAIWQGWTDGQRKPFLDDVANVGTAMNTAGASSLHTEGQRWE